MRQLPRFVARLLPALGLALAGAWFVLGINWGLPTRRADAFLFGDASKAWDGARILELAGGWDDDPNRGADVDRSPVSSRDVPVVLNATDAQRAEIVRRYRLFSYQPDEMITFRALSQMRPGEKKLDPKLYQYGGLWIYPVGVLLKVASILKLVDVRSDLSYYLDHPEQFGRFYVVARLYSAAWGVVGVWAVYRLVRRLTANTRMAALAPVAAAACFAAMPVVVNMAHEAKPHLPGAVLMLLAVLAASDYVTSGRRRSWVASGALCGAAFGMVLSALPVFVVLPLMALLRREIPWRDRLVVLLAAVFIGVDVYFLTNPYVLLHLVGRDEVLRSNLGNSAAMYSVGGSAGALVTAASLLREGAGTLVAVGGVVGAVALALRAYRVRNDTSPAEAARRATGLLLAAPALLVLLQFVALAAGKPGEYGRFAMLPCVFLMIEAVVAIATLDDLFVAAPGGRYRPGPIMFACFTLSTLTSGGAYLGRFLADTTDRSTRLRAATILAEIPGSAPIAVEAEPAPYSLPPVNLFTRQIVLLPRNATAAPGRAWDAPEPLDKPMMLVRPVDVPGNVAVPPPSPFDRVSPGRISWAGKYFGVTPAPGLRD